MIEEYGEVFQRFGIEPQESVYAYAPVFKGEIDGRPVAVKRTHAAARMGRWVRALSAGGVPVVTPVAGPERIGDADWVAYPWIDGRLYDGSAADAAQAGALLGLIHAAEPVGDGLPAFSWPDHDDKSVEEDVEGLDRVLARHRPDLRAPVLARLEPLLRAFMADTLPAVRDARLPVVDASLDYKAVNLVYGEPAGAGDHRWAGPVLIDPDNGERVPRLLDLALAVLLFHNDLPGEPAGLFEPEQWTAFRDAYLAEVELTPIERELWPTALRYMLLEWGVWTAISGDEAGDWANPRQAAFLSALLTVDETAFPL